MALNLTFMTLLTFGLVLLTSINAAPISRSQNEVQHQSADHDTSRSRRQTLGESTAVAQSVSECPDYFNEGQCDKVQDILCLADTFKDQVDYWITRQREQVSVQSIQRCALIVPHSGNNLRSHYQDLVTLSSIFRQVGHLLLPNESLSDVLCQLEYTVSYLDNTVNKFCQHSSENCSDVAYTCDTNFPPNANYNYTGLDDFNATCSRELFDSLQAALRLIHMYMVESSPDTPVCAHACFRATNEEEDSLEEFKLTLNERQRNLSAIAPALHEKCWPSELFGQSTAAVYKSLVETVAVLNTSAPSEEDLLIPLNETILPLLKDLVGRVVTNETELEELNTLLPSNIQNISDLTSFNLTSSCLVTRLFLGYNIILTERLGNKWTILYRQRYIQNMCHA